MESCGFWFEDFDNDVMFRVMIRIMILMFHHAVFWHHKCKGVGVPSPGAACPAVLTVDFDGALSVSTIVV